jgi:acid phosphatase (class A)
MRTLKRCLSLASVIFVLALAVAPLHAANTNLYFSSKKVDFLALLPPPPAPNSVEQNADLTEVRTVHSQCGPDESALAMSETKFTIFSFTPAVGPFLQPGKFPKTEELLARAQKTASAVVDTAKDYWMRPRPFMVDTNLAAGELEKSFSYPSGHSTRGTVLSLLLAELFPDQSDAILAEGKMIGWHRVEIARHYPTDIFAGRVLARAIVRELHKNAEFEADFDAAKAEIAAALAPVPATAQK